MLRQLYHKYAAHNETIRTTVQTVNSTKGNIQHFIHHFKVLSLTKVQGDLGNIIFVGPGGPVKVQVLNTLFPDGWEETFLEDVPAWRLPQRMPKLLAENEMVVCRVSRFFPLPVRAAYAFDNPLTIQQMLLLDRPLDEMLAGGSNHRLRADVNRMLKRNYTVRISHSEEDLRYFYDRMYIPTLQKRHEDRALQYPYETLEKQLETGFLMFLSAEDKEILGSLSYSRGKVIYGSYMGLLDGDLSLMKRDANLALYWFSISTAIERKMEAINFSTSNAWTKDGVFYFKQRWGAHTYPNTYENEKLLVRANTVSTGWRDRLNDIGFITQQGKQLLRVYIDEAVPTVDEAQALAEKNGLSGIHVLSPRKSVGTREAKSPSINNNQAG